MYVDIGYAIVTSCDSIVSDDSVTQLNALLADTGVPLLDVNSGEYSITLRACACQCLCTFKKF